MKRSIHFLVVSLLTFVAAARAQSPVLRVDFNDRAQNPTALTMPDFASFIISSNISSGAIQTNATIRDFFGITLTLSNSAPFGYDDRLRAAPTNNAAFNNALLLRDFVFSRDLNTTGGLDVSLTGLTPDQLYNVRIWSFDASSGGLRVSDWFLNGVLLFDNYTFDGRVLPVNDSTNSFVLTGAADCTGTLVIQGRRDASSVGPTGVPDFGVF